jgi:hypothetical protein
MCIPLRSDLSPNTPQNIKKLLTQTKSQLSILTGQELNTGLSFYQLLQELFLGAPHTRHVSTPDRFIPFLTKEEAFDTARKVCLKIKPRVFFVYDYLEEKHRRNSKNR